MIILKVFCYKEQDPFVICSLMPTDKQLASQPQVVCAKYPIIYARYFKDLLSTTDRLNHMDQRYSVKCCYRLDEMPGVIVLTEKICRAAGFHGEAA